MDAITMLSTKNLLAKLESDFPEFKFKKSDCFLWSPKQKTIFFEDISDNFQIYLIHEIAHAILGHSDYDRDIELVKMESEAWYKAIEIAKKYSINIDENWIQDTLDTYREWLHLRSTCPDCKANGIQKEQKHYQCIACGRNWRVNEAKTCGLKRYSIDKQI
jgi:Zn finger protein HypA/HybF involved in hydrogenase expression